MWFITNKIAFRSIKLIKCKWYCLLLYGSFEINQQVMIYCDLIVLINLPDHKSQRRVSRVSVGAV